jgi:hypothetical protein
VANRLWYFWGLAFTLIGALSCEKIASIEKKTLVPVKTPPTCSELLSTTDFGLRIANLITTDTKLDVCVRPAGGQFPSTPLLKSGATGCPDGVGYAEYTMPLKIDAGTYDFKLVPAASASCAVDGPTASSVTVAGNQSVSLIAYGTSNTDAGVAALNDTTNTGPSVYMRLFHAENGQGAVDVGTDSSSAATPNTIGISIFDNVEFGHIAAKNNNYFAVDELGYMKYPNSGNDPGIIKTAVRATGTVSTFLKVSAYLKTSHHYDLFLIGNAGDTQTYKPKLWSCDEGVADTSGLFSQCGDPRDVQISIFHPNLTDLFTDYISQRADPARDSIVGSSADVLCVPELYSPALRDKLKTALASKASTTSLILSDDYVPLATSDLTDRDGNAVTWSDRACEDTVAPYATALANLRDCLVTLPCIDAVGAGGDASTVKHYFNVDGSAAIGCVGGKIAGSRGCMDQAGMFILSQTHAADQCFMCAITHLSSGESIEDMYTACTAPSGNRPHFVYGGSTGLALISRVGVVSDEPPEVTVLPASNWNRAALRVPLRLDNNAVVDVWCTNVRAPNNDPFILNGGPYYGDAPAANPEPANTAEQRLQIQRLINIVNQQAQNSGRRAIVLALTYASPNIVDPVTNAELVTGLATDNYALFQQEVTWQELVAPSWTPSCTWCSDNPLNSGVNQAIVHMFGVGIGASAVSATSTTFKGQDLQLHTYDDKNIQAPVSQYYGLQSTVRVTQ